MRTETMKTTLRTILAMCLLIAGASFAQDRDRDELKIVALESLMSAPPDVALAQVTKVLQSEQSEEVKEAALFVLSQLEGPEAGALLLEMARNSSGELQEEAIQMIGINGNRTALDQLGTLYAEGNSEVREAVLEAYLIAGEEDRIYDVAVNATTVEELEAAVEMLAAIGATEELRHLRESGQVTPDMIEMFALSGDFETVRQVALDTSNPDAQIEAIGALGLVGNDEANATLLQMYRQSDDWDIKEAALEGMLIAGYDDGAVTLYRETDNVEEKTMLLEFLSAMGSDQLWTIVDEALENRR